VAVQGLLTYAEARRLMAAADEERARRESLRPV